MRYNREDWIRTGLEQLSQLGPDGVKLDNVCKVQGRTSGAFYSHFKDHAEFLTELVAHWEKTHTDDIIAASQEQAERLYLLVGELDHRLGVAMRLWGYRSQKISEKLAEIDEKRIMFLAKLHIKSKGVDQAAGRELAELEYAAFIGTQMVWQSNTPAQNKKLMATFNRLVKR